MLSVRASKLFFFFGVIKDFNTVKFELLISTFKKKNIAPALQEHNHKGKCNKGLIMVPEMPKYIKI
jgi:hypothetical protein